MKRKYRLKRWVIISIYVCGLSIVLSSAVMLNRLISRSLYADETLSYVYRGILDRVTPVVKNTNEKVIRPFESETVEIVRSFYNKDDLEDNQEKSIIFYQNTYMPNTGVLYKSNEEFDVIAPLDGTVVDIVADEIIGNIVTIKHTNSLITVYQSLNEVDVLIGDLLKQGDVIGTSGSNKIIADSDFMLLFEVINNGEYINPEDFYNMTLEDLN